MKYFCFPDDKFVLNRGSCTIIACSLDRDKGELAKSMEGFVFSRWSIWLARRKRYDKINSIAEVHYSDKLLVRGMKNLHHQLTLRREKQMNRIGEARHTKHMLKWGMKQLRRKYVVRRQKQTENVGEVHYRKYFLKVAVQKLKNQRTARRCVRLADFKFKRYLLRMAIKHLHRRRDASQSISCGVAHSVYRMASV